MREKFFVWLLATVLLSIAPLAEAQQPTKIPLGFLSANSRAPMSARYEAFRQGLRELGYVEGKNIVIESRYTEGKLDSLPALAAELVRLKVDVIVTEGTTATRFAKEATSSIPIVMAQDPDPVGTGFVASLAQPGGNITGLSNLRPELSGKRLELMKEIVPRLARLSVLGTSTVPGNAQSLKEMELGASAFGVQLQYLDVLGPKEIETVFRAASKGRADAVLVLGSPFLLSHRTQVVDLALKSRTTAVHGSRWNSGDRARVDAHRSRICSSRWPHVLRANPADSYRRVAYYADKILK